jgi:hypothetical protein
MGHLLASEIADLSDYDKLSRPWQCGTAPGSDEESRGVICTVIAVQLAFGTGKPNHAASSRQ